ncbi:MAG: hypothetical protein MK193_12960 [Lentisphaeria bacterium]|nr:hypothetical protein [Lentisphaeria bacterium]
MSTSTLHWNIPVQTHGRVAIDHMNIESGDIDYLIVAFHGYTGNATHALEIAKQIQLPGKVVSLGIQGLHRFYKNGEIAASYMTREDRESAIHDNIEYFNQVMNRATTTWNWKKLVICGFSQGAAMAMRAAANLNCNEVPIKVITVGGDIPKDIYEKLNESYPPQLLVRGEQDKLYTEEIFEQDRKLISKHNAPIKAITLPGKHRWDNEVSKAAKKFIIQENI